MSNNNLEFKNIKEYLDNKALVLDIRTELEYNEGHIKDSLHIVLDDLKYEIDQLKTLQKPIITCCRSEARSEHAKDLLLEHNIDVINGGP